MMRQGIVLLCLIGILAVGIVPAFAQNARFNVLAFYSDKTEADHVEFAEEAIRFYSDLAPKNNFTFKATTDWNELNSAELKNYQVILWLNGSPVAEAQRKAFEDYMDHGGAWLGFHAAAYNDADTHWAWFVDLLGGTVFYGNNWPPLPARLSIDDKSDPVTRHLPANFVSPANEWYIWKPSPRDSANVKVLLTIDPANYPLGLKDVIKGGDCPVVWRNTRYKMIYMNMGHGGKIFTNPDQNRMFEDALLWLAGRR